MNRLDGKVALISGAARGIGAETARLMVETGAKVAIGDVLDERGRDTARALGDVLYAHLDVTREEDWNAAVDACAMETPKIPVVGNVHAKPMLTADELRSDIKAQMQSRVRWTESVQLMQLNGIQAYVEAGSGEVLLGMIKRIYPDSVRCPLGAPKDFIALAE